MGDPMEGNVNGCRVVSLDRSAAIAHLRELAELFTNTPELPWGPDHILLDLPGKWLQSLVLLDDDDIIGAIFASVKPVRVVWVHAIIVHPARRGAGLSSLLLRAAIRAATRDGFDAIGANVARDNSRSLHSFLRNGFRVIALDEALDQLEVRLDVSGMPE